MTDFSNAGGNDLSCGYAPDGLRAWRQWGPSNTGRYYFIYDGSTPVAELDHTGGLKAINTFGANGLISRMDNWAGGTSVFYLFDERGNTAQRLNASGSILDNNFVSAFGGEFVYDASGTYLPNGTGDPYEGFGAQYGYYKDQGTNFLLCGNRYYDPVRCGWLTRDPIGYDGGLNLYAYCNGDPINSIDPLGLINKNPDFNEGGIVFDGGESPEIAGSPVGFSGTGTHETKITLRPMGGNSCPTRLPVMQYDASVPAEDGMTLYRGVGNNDGGVQDALAGKAIPRGQEYGYDPAMVHDDPTLQGVNNMSTMTSWTTDEDTAIKFALGETGGEYRNEYGVVLKATFPGYNYANSPIQLSTSLTAINESEMPVRAEVGGASISIIVFKPEP